MGCNNSKIAVDASETSNSNNICQKQTNSAFENPIDFPLSYGNFINSEVQFRILLIGPENSGKTTLWNNLEINILNSNKDYESKARAIKKYLIETSKSLFKIIESNEIEVNTLNITPPTEDNLTDEFSDSVLSIWNNNKVQTSYQQNDNFGFYSNESFFLSNTRRIASNNYKPTKEDILRCYFHQKGTFSSSLLINNTIKAELIDITHQNISFYGNNFKEINYLIFAFSLPDFDRKLFNESIDLFHQTLNSTFFMKVPILLLLNKTDLFEQKLKGHPQKFKDAFPDFNGKTDDTDSCILHIKNRFFQEIPKNRNTETYWVDAISSCAIDEQSCRKVFQIIARRIIGIPKKQGKGKTEENLDKKSETPLNKQEKAVKEEEKSEKNKFYEDDQNSHKLKNQEKKQQTPKEPSENKSSANSPRNPTGKSHKKSSSSPKETKNSENLQTKSSTKKDSPPKNEESSNQLQQQSKSKNNLSKKSSEKSISDSSQKVTKTVIKIISDKPLKEKADDEISIYEYASEYISETDSYSEYYNSSYFY